MTYDATPELVPYLDNLAFAVAKSTEALEDARDLLGESAAEAADGFLDVDPNIGDLVLGELDEAEGLVNEALRFHEDWLNKILVTSDRLKRTRRNA
jgi:hypothetical protein